MIGMRIKGETTEEIAAAAQVMREQSQHVTLTNRQYLIDTCGTGGDSLQTFNVSTLSAIISAAAGARVAKHGGRSVSSKCGSADVLEALGVNVNLTHESIAALVDKIGIGFMLLLQACPNYLESEDKKSLQKNDPTSPPRRSVSQKSSELRN